MWKIESGEYTYTLFPLFDVKRRIVGNQPKPFSVQLVTGGNGVLIYLNGLDDVGYSAIIRIYRQISEGGHRYYVDIPLCGAHFLYDNGLTINGYSWQSVEDNDIYYTREESNTEYDILTYHDNRLNCQGPKSTNRGDWQPGDIIINNELSSSTNLWIRNENGGWITRY